MLSPMSNSRTLRRLRPKYTAAESPAGPPPTITVSQRSAPVSGADRESVNFVFKDGTERLASSSAMGTLSALANRFFSALDVLSCRAAGVLDRLLTLLVVFLPPLHGTVPRSPSAFPCFILGA